MEESENVKKSVKLREQDDDFGTEEVYREDVPIQCRKLNLKNDPMDRSTIMAKNKGKKDAPDKGDNLFNE